MLLTVQLVSRANRQHTFRSALGDQQSLVLVLDYNRDTTPFEVEGNLVNLPVGVNVRVIVLQDGCVERIATSALLDRLIQWITDACFGQAVEVGEQKDAFRCSGQGVKVRV